LLLSNAWDSASAALLQDAGARAIGASSGALDCSLGYQDGGAPAAQRIASGDRKDHAGHQSAAHRGYRRWLFHRSARGWRILFVPGLKQTEAVAKPHAQVDLIVNLLALPQLPDIVELFAAGVRRISLGNSAACANFSGARVCPATEARMRLTVLFAMPTTSRIANSTPRISTQRLLRLSCGRRMSRQEAA